MGKEISRGTNKDTRGSLQRMWDRGLLEYIKAINAAQLPSILPRSSDPQIVKLIERYRDVELIDDDKKPFKPPLYKDAQHLRSLDAYLQARGGFSETQETILATLLELDSRKYGKEKIARKWGFKLRRNTYLRLGKEVLKKRISLENDKMDVWAFENRPIPPGEQSAHIAQKVLESIAPTGAIVGLLATFAPGDPPRQEMQTPIDPLQIAGSVGFGALIGAGVAAKSPGGSYIKAGLGITSSIIGGLAANGVQDFFTEDPQPVSVDVYDDMWPIWPLRGLGMVASLAIIANGFYQGKREERLVQELSNNARQFPRILSDLTRTVQAIKLLPDSQNHFPPNYTPPHWASNPRLDGLNRWIKTPNLSNVESLPTGPKTIADLSFQSFAATYYRRHKIIKENSDSVLSLTPSYEALSQGIYDDPGLNLDLSDNIVNRISEDVKGAEHAARLLSMLFPSVLNLYLLHGNKRTTLENLFTEASNGDVPGTTGADLVLSDVFYKYMEGNEAYTDFPRTFTTSDDVVIAMKHAREQSKKYGDDENFRYGPLLGMDFVTRLALTARAIDALDQDKSTKGKFSDKDNNIDKATQALDPIVGLHVLADLRTILDVFFPQSTSVELARRLSSEISEDVAPSSREEKNRMAIIRIMNSIVKQIYNKCIPSTPEERTAFLQSGDQIQKSVGILRLLEGIVSGSPAEIQLRLELQKIPFMIDFSNNSYSGKEWSQTPISLEGSQNEPWMSLELGRLYARQLTESFVRMAPEKQRPDRVERDLNYFGWSRDFIKQHVTHLLPSGDMDTLFARMSEAMMEWSKMIVPVTLADVQVNAIGDRIDPPFLMADTIRSHIGPMLRCLENPDNRDTMLRRYLYEHADEDPSLLSAHNAISQVELKVRALKEVFTSYDNYINSCRKPRRAD